jgi:hypothetical protein
MDRQTLPKISIVMATETITGHFTCDNNYAVYVGDQNSVVTKVLPTTGDGVTNTNATQIFQGDDVTFTADPGDYFYIIAWSDDSGKQGLVGEFSGTKTIFTGDAAWEVYPTGKNYNNDSAPKMAEINNHITAANAASGWKATTVGPRNADSDQIFSSGNPNLKVANIDDEAKWIWYDSGKNPGASVFQGFNHEEFLIFRIPTEKMTEPVDPVDPSTPSHECCCGCQSQPIICCPAPEKTAQFDVAISRVRIAKNSARDGKGEFMLTGYASGVSAVVPGMGSYITLFTNWGWRVMNKYVTSVSVKEDQTVTVPLMAEAVQSIASGMRMGASQELKSLQLTAGKATEPQILTIECIDARSNGNRENVFVLEVEFIAFQK